MSETVYMLTGEQLEQLAQRVCEMLEERRAKHEFEVIYMKKTCSKTEAADHLGVHRLTIYNMVRDGRLKASSDGRVIVQSIIDYENGVKQTEKTRVNKRGNKVYV